MSVLFAKNRTDRQRALVAFIAIIAFPFLLIFVLFFQTTFTPFSSISSIPPFTPDRDRGLPPPIENASEEDTPACSRNLPGTRTHHSQEQVVHLITDRQQ